MLAMFYKEEDIAESISCPECKNKYEDPVILNCGHSLCFKHVSKNKNGIKCQECENFNEQPKNGFVKNIILANLVRINSSDAFRGALTEDFKAKLNEIDEKLISFKNQIKSRREQVKEYCDDLRKQVEKETELRIKEINKINKELVNKINEYEVECYSKWNEDKDYEEELKKTTTDMYKFHVKWTSYLKEFKLDESEIDAASNDASAKLDKLDYEAIEFNKRIFNGIELKFNKYNSNFDTSLIGIFKYERRRHLLNTEIKNLRTISFMNKLKNYQSGQLVKVKYLNEKKILMAYSVSTSSQHNQRNPQINNYNYGYNNQNTYITTTISTQDTRLATLNEQGEILKEFSCALPKSDYVSNDLPSCIRIQNIHLSFIDSLIYFFVAYNDNYYGNKVTIFVFNENSDSSPISVRTFDHQSSLLFCDYNDEFFFFNNGKFSVLNKYLTKTKDIGQNDPKLPYYLPTTITKFDVNDKYFIYSNNNEINLLHKVVGLTRKFSMIANDFYLYLEKSLLVYDNNQSILNVYDFRGNKAEIKCQDYIPKGFQLADVSKLDKNVIFFNQNELTIKF